MRKNQKRNSRRFGGDQYKDLLRKIDLGNSILSRMEREIDDYWPCTQNRALSQEERNSLLDLCEGIEEEISMQSAYLAGLQMELQWWKEERKRSC